MKFEYKIVDVEFYHLNQELNQLGSDGWELVQLLDTSKDSIKRLILKRKKK